MDIIGIRKNELYELLSYEILHFLEANHILNIDLQKLISEYLFSYNIKIGLMTDTLPYFSIFLEKSLKKNVYLVVNYVNMAILHALHLKSNEMYLRSGYTIQSKKN